jgi:hypothetical protein
LHRTAESIRIVALPDLPDKGDVSDWLDADPRRAEKLERVCYDVPVWIPGAAAAFPKTAVTSDAKSPNDSPLPFINIAAWQNRGVPERTWTVKDRIPMSNVTLLSGEGSIGKSILSLHLSTAVVLGRDWLGAIAGARTGDRRVL